MKELQRYFEIISQLGYKCGSLSPAHSSFCGSTTAKQYSLEGTLDQGDSKEGPENTEPDYLEDFTTDTEDETEFEED